jgi:hypothetical protein
VTIDINQNLLRFFETGGTNRGYYIDVTTGGASVGTSLTGGSTGAMNYAQTEGTKQSAISSVGTTIVSVSITTNGYPVQVSVTGDVENNTAGGWVVLQLYRGATAIGNPIHAEASAGSENVPYALSVIDAPAAGTYTYALKLNNSAGGTFNFGESDGPVITAIELSGPKGDTGATGPTFTGGTITNALVVSNTGGVNTSGQFITTIATGTAPFVVSSTTQVANLNSATSGISVNIGAGAAGSLPYQSAANTTTFLARTATNNSTLLFNSSTNAPFWVQPTLSNTYYAATTSAQLAGTISDETGSGSLVFSTNPSLDGMTLNAGTSLIVEDADSVVGRVIGSGNVLYIQAGADSTDGTGHIFVGRYANSNPVANITLNGTTTNVATNLVVGGTANIAGQITSTLANGTAPFVVTSTTQVANLNVAVSGLAVNVIGGTANKGELLYQSGVNTTAELTAPATNNSILGYNTSTNAPFWVSPTLSNTYFAATTSAQLAGVVSDETGTGNLVFSTSPTLTTPRLANSTTTATAGLKDFDGTVFYSTTSTTPGKALDVASYYYVSDSQYVIDSTSAGVTLSLLGASSRGITVPAGTTYEYEGLFVISATFIATSQTPTINLISTTVSGSPVLAHQTVVESGNNATGIGSASAMSAYRFTTTGIALTALTTGSRWYTVKMRGRIAVTGTGTIEIYPSIRFSAGSVDNSWIVEPGSIFRMTPIGNGTVTSVGTWA